MNAFWASFRYSFKLFLVKENHIEGMEKKYLTMILKELIHTWDLTGFNHCVFENHSAVFLREKSSFFWEMLPGMGLLLSCFSFSPH